MPSFRSLASALSNLFVLCAITGGSLCHAASEKTAIPGTSLKIDLPAGWSVGPSPFGFKTDVLRHDGSPRYSIQVNESTVGVQANPQMPPTSSCSFLLGVMLSTVAGKSANRISRPASFPDTFDGLVIEIPNKLLMGCVNAGARIVGVTVYLQEGRPQPELLAPILEKISDAAFEGQTFVERPGRLHLKLLNIDVPVPQGKWSAQEDTNAWGRNDMIVRVLGQKELHITPFVFPYPGVCAVLALADDKIAATVVKNPGYVGADWAPKAYVQVPPPGTFSLATVCRDIASGRMLFAQIMEEGEVIQEADYGVISMVLEGIGNAVDQKIRTEGMASLRTSTVAVPTTVVEPQAGTRVVLNAPPAEIVSRVPPVYPPLARQARIQGTVVLKAVIATDGSVKSLELVSGHPMLVPAAMDAARQWRFKPYLVGDLPVEVETTVNVNFQLQ